jgi:hypothetical protein
MRHTIHIHGERIKENNYTEHVEYTFLLNQTERLAFFLCVRKGLRKKELTQEGNAP